MGAASRAHTYTYVRIYMLSLIWLAVKYQARSTSAVAVHHTDAGTGSSSSELSRRHLLAGGRGQPAIRIERGFGDTQQDGLRRSGFAALCQDSRILLRISKTINEVVWQHIGIARLLYTHAAQHLPDDNLDMLVIDIHTSVAIDLLDFLHQVGLHSFAALDAQDILWVALPTGNRRARRDFLSLRNGHTAGCRDRIGTLLTLFKANGEQSVLANLRLALGTRQNWHRFAAVLGRHEGNHLVFLHVFAIVDQHLAALGQRVLVEEDVG